MNTTTSFQMVAKTMAELEDVLAEELIELGAQNVEKGIRMVSFTGDNALLYKANLHCRTALRILKPIHTFVANNADEVYEEIKKIDWEEYLTLEKTFSIDAVVFSHIFRHSKFVSYRVKDAIVDFFSEKYEKRPSVSVTNPDLVFNIHIAHNKCTLSLDSSGESLHKRGYRIEQTDAPLSEVLAAGMILKSGWRGGSTFIDPMCGSGTLLIEAAMIALNIPPGIHRDSFAFEKWNDFDKDLFSEVYNDDSGAQECMCKIIGSDISGHAISIAEKNIKNAGLKKYITLEVKPFQQYTEAPEPVGVLMSNPPYGERIRVEDIEALYNMIGERIKHVFSGYDAYILSFKKENFDNIGLRPAKRFFLFNGALECEMRKYEIFAGKRNDRPKDEESTRRYDRDNRPVGDNKREFKHDDRGGAVYKSRGDDRDGFKERDRSWDKDKNSSVDRSRGSDRDKNSTVDRPRGGDRDRSWVKDKDKSGDSARGGDRERKPHTDYKPYDRKNIVFDHETNLPVFKKKESEDHQQRREPIDFKLRKIENREESPGAERRVNKVFIARKHPTKSNESEADLNKNDDSDKE
ncbi:MAG: THUMP domain-containing protein [Candidatus Saccharimonadaceae bacterium]